ncbi:UNVERIFIED_ORG: hypothetical protein BDU10_2516 [Burkholderia sp. CF145]
MKRSISIVTVTIAILTGGIPVHAEVCPDWCHYDNEPKCVCRQLSTKFAWRYSTRGLNGGGSTGPASGGVNYIEVDKTLQSLQGANANQFKLPDKLDVQRIIDGGRFSHSPRYNAIGGDGQ